MSNVIRHKHTEHLIHIATIFACPEDMTNPNCSRKINCSPSTKYVVSIKEKEESNIKQILTKVATVPIYAEFFSRTKNRKYWNLVESIDDLRLITLIQMEILCWPLTFFSAVRLTSQTGKPTKTGYWVRYDKRKQLITDRHDVNIEKQFPFHRAFQSECQVEGF